MLRAMFVVSSVATGAFAALGARMFGIERDDVLVAIGIMGAGLQMLLLIGWWLWHSRGRDPSPPDDA